MRQFLKRMLRFLFRPSSDGTPCAGGTKTEVQVLREKIRKWERQADEYESMGLTQLARRSREGLVWYRRRLKVLEDPSFRRAA